MRLSNVCLFLITLLFAGSAQAVVKAYNSSLTNGAPSDSFVTTANLCPTVNPDTTDHGGYQTILDDALGTVTLSELVVTTDSLNDISADGGRLIPLFGPGAFFFAEGKNTLAIGFPHVSNSTGIGAHGPSSTAPAGSAEWGIVSGFTVTGFSFCLSSPVSICNANVSPHGATAGAVLNSSTYDLGTWSFDSVGNMEAQAPYIRVTATGGLTNVRHTLRGAFQGTSLPALPLMGFGALALGLSVVGFRTIRARK